MNASTPISTTGSPLASDLGPLLHKDGVTYRVWAKGRTSVDVHIEKPGMAQRTLHLEQANDSGYFYAIDSAGKAGDLYKFSIDGGMPIPDFVSHYQPQGVMGPSMVVDAASYDWQAKTWTRPPWTGHVIYECHIGTFTPGGTFRSAIEKLDHLCALGVTAMQIMPVAQWAGTRGWGYDGVMLFAPHHAYGSPHDFRALIDACHLRGLAVILDVVFNHLGPEGNFSHQFSDYYFHGSKDTQWGQNFNLDGLNSEPVRALLRQNIRYWLEDFRIDGFRMDATPAVYDPSPVHILSEVAEVVHQHGGFIIAEDDRNLRMVLETPEKGGWNFNAVWSDDFHHVMRVSQTGEQQYLFGMFKGIAEEIVETLRRGWFYSGEINPVNNTPRGTPGHDFPPECFVYCISNHDQAGNRLVGERLNHDIAPAAYRALSLFLCLTPYTPMLFMGQEWGAATPFLYFTEMPDDLGVKIGAGRKRELLENKFANSIEVERMPNPQDPTTFFRSRLDWNEIQNDGHRHFLDLYKAGLKLRKELFGLTNPSRDSWRIEERRDEVIIHYTLVGRQVAVHLCLRRTNNPPPGPTILLRSNAPEFTPNECTEPPETFVVESP